MKIYGNLGNLNEDQGRQTPWGFWPTLGISALIILANVISGSMAAIVFAAFTGNSDVMKNPGQLVYNGNLVTASILMTSPLIFALTFFFANLRRGVAVKDYLGLHEVNWKQMIQWVLVLLSFAAASELVTLLLKRPIAEPFLSMIYSTASSTPLLWTALVVAAPVSEEIFFRGFLFYGILKTKLGWVGAVVLSSLIWAPLHIQYDLYGVATVLALGLLFGYARWRTNSVYMPIVMHALMNVIAAMEVMLHIARVSPGS